MYVTVISHSFTHGIVEMGKAVFTSPVSLLTEGSSWLVLTDQGSPAGRRAALIYKTLGGLRGALGKSNSQQKKRALFEHRCTLTVLIKIARQLLFTNNPKGKSLFQYIKFEWTKTKQHILTWDDGSSSSKAGQLSPPSPLSSAPPATLRFTHCFLGLMVICDTKIFPRIAGKQPFVNFFFAKSFHKRWWGLFID